MSHVDEGALHAFLDGALDELPGGEGATIRAHLGACAACARRLEKERALRDEASAILAAGDPELGELPSLEDLRERAHGTVGSAAPRGMVRTQRLAWAASVVVALGVGWSLREATAPGGALDAALDGAPASPIAAEQARSVSGPGTGREAAEVEEGEPGGDVEGDLAGFAAAEREELAAPEASADRTGVAGASRAAPTSPLSSEARREAVTSVLTVEQRVVASALDARSAEVEAFADVVDSLPRPPLRVPPIFRTDSAGFTLPSRLGTRAALPASLADAPATVDAVRDSVLRSASLTLEERDPGGARDEDAGASTSSLIVPGLRVLRVSRLDGGRVPGAVRVLQLMADGDTLEVVHLPGGTAPSDLVRAEADTRNEVAVPHGGGWLVARANAPTALLRSLVDRLAASR